MELKQLYRSFLEELSDEPAECEVTYKKIGCYNENSGDRALSENLFSMRKNINWKPGEWEKFLKRLACRCAKKTSDTGYSYFGLQFYGECWSNRLAEKRYERYGKSPDCMGFQYKRCNDEDENECVGRGTKNYMYKIVGEGGSTSGIGPIS